MADTKLTAAQEATLSVIMNAQLALKQAELEISKMTLAYLGHVTQGAALDADELFQHLTVAIGLLPTVEARLRLFANFIRDNRTKAQLNAARMHKYHYGTQRDLPLHEQDPKDVLAHMVERIEERRREDEAKEKGE